MSSLATSSLYTNKIIINEEARARGNIQLRRKRVCACKSKETRERRRKKRSVELFIQGDKPINNADMPNKM